MGSPLGVADLVAGFRALGVRPGDDLLVHSSLSSLGFVEGGASAVCEALVRAVSPGGTVCCPTITGSRSYSPSNPPRFSPEDPCWTGAIPEAMRHRPDAVRSLHPTHSVACVGPRARELTAGHELSETPCGEDSPYMRLARSGGRILFIGCDFSSNTTLHSVEELAGVGYVCQASPVEAVIIDPAVGERTVRIRIHLYGPKRAFRKVEGLLEAAGVLRRGTVGAAECILVEAGPMVELVLAELARDPEYLLAGSERGRGWSEARRNAED